MTADWLPGAIVGAVAGIGGSVTAAWLQRPAASAAAETAREETKDLRTHRRWLISNGRDLVGIAHREGWSDDRISADPRYLALRRHLSVETLERYAQETYYVGHTTEDYITAHDLLLNDLDQLEAQWKLA